MVLIAFAFFEALFILTAPERQIELCGHLTQHTGALDKELLQLNVLMRKA